MLRGDATRAQKVVALALAGALGAAAAALVLAGNPGNMGLCGACFLRDWSGALGLTSKGPAILRPELIGVVLGAFALALARRSFVARSGGHAASRFALGVIMAIAALVFLGCPLRMLQRLGGGDLTAWLALPGFFIGVGLGVRAERKGYDVGDLTDAPATVGLWAPAAAVCALALWFAGLLLGPGPGATTGPAHAPWWLALTIGGAAGAALSWTTFCPISAARGVFSGQRRMLAGMGLFVVAFAAVLALGGRFAPGLSAQPIAHGDLLWNGLALVVLGLAGALADGCPVRQIVKAGEGNGDAFVCLAGLVTGGALAHNLGLVSAAASATSPGGPTRAGEVALVVSLVVCLAYAAFVARALSAPASPTP